MSATVCPNCNKALPAAVVSGPAQAVVRCEGCQTLLLWSNGRVMRSAKSSTGTMMGMPAVKVPAAPVAKDADAPLPELKPEGDGVPVTAKPGFPKPPPPKTPPPRSATQPLARVAPQKSSVTGLAETPTKVAPPPPELRKEAARKDPTPAPMKVPPSGPVKLPPPPAPAKPAATGMVKPVAAPARPLGAPAKPAAATARPAATAPKPEAPTSDSGKSESPHVVVAAVAQVPQMPNAGDMVDPSAWFAGGEVSDVVPPEKLPAIESTKEVRADSTGAAPLPPPPSLGVLEAEPLEIEAFGEEKTPAVPISVMDLPSGPIATNLREPSQKVKTPAVREPSQKVSTQAVPTAAAREPSQKVSTQPPAKRSAAAIRGADPLVPAASAVSSTTASTDLPSASTTIAKAPEPPVSSRATVMGRPALEMPKPAEPVAAAVSMLPPSPAAPTPVAPPLGVEPAAPARPEVTPVKPHAAINTPAPVPAREPSAEPLPAPPPTESPAPLPVELEATSQTAMPPLVTSKVPKTIPRRLLFIVGGAASGVIVLVVLVAAFSRGAKPPVPPAKTPPVAAATKPEAVAPTPPAPVPTPAPPAPAPAPVAPPTTPTTAPSEPSVAAVTPPPSPPRPRHTLGGKKVVLEYDPKPTSPAPPTPQAPTPMGEDPATVARAREAYHKGNVKLFAGDSAGAIALYRESLKIYPGYVAGYRGLGLGYEAAGQKEEALKAFHTYVRTVPSANDTPIIRRRIDHLEAMKP